ncbi:flagellar biosynthesis protein flip, partial [Escherichia coli]
MRRLLSVAPVLLWLVTPLAFAQLPGITSQP